MYIIAGDAVAKWNPDMETNPEELGEYAQGDILFPANTARNGLKAASTHWEKGIVPYEIGPYFSKCDLVLSFIWDALSFWRIIKKSMIFIRSYKYPMGKTLILWKLM